VVSRGVVLEIPAITVEVREQHPNETPSAREPHYQPERASSRPVEAFKRRCPGEAQEEGKRQHLSVSHDRNVNENYKILKQK